MSIRADELHTMDFSDVATNAERLSPITPGEVLREEFMAPLGLSARALARELGWPPSRVTAIMAGERTITAESAIVLADRFGTSAEFWMNLQTGHDLEAARRDTTRKTEPA